MKEVKLVQLKSSSIVLLEVLGAPTSGRCALAPLSNAMRIQNYIEKIFTLSENMSSLNNNFKGSLIRNCISL
jgi:hypothetical protein